VARTGERPSAAASSPAEPLVTAALIRDFVPGKGLAEGAAAADHQAPGWVAVSVPGDVHSALVASGRLPDPFYDRNEDVCRWVEEREWWYRLTFEGPAPAGPDERLRLVFHGLDTFATVYLNGEKLGAHENMFRAAVFDVTERLLAEGENLLALRFDPPLSRVGSEVPEQWAPFNHERVWMRKGQFGYGWDWGPRLPTVGIWRPVELRRERCAAITGVTFTTLRLSAGAEEALVEVRLEVEHFAGDGEVHASVELRPPDGGEPIEAPIPLIDGRGSVLLRLREPQLWWTHDLGEPALHDLRVRLLVDGEEVEEQVRPVGVRTIDLDQRPDPEEPGTRFFRFVLNGVPLFARGANWIPLDSFVGAIPSERYESRVEDAREANMNMLRVWGGGIYEHDVFYDLCDRLGLLVWQDFMFACGAYPERALASEVELEARFQVARLRNHACLALWCGNNECQWIHDLRHPGRGGERVPGALLYDDVLPRVVAELDRGTPYWPGSPYGGSDHNAREDGDVHNWEVWHGNHPRRFSEPSLREPTPESVSFLRYAEDMGRFISEFGVLAAPNRETLRRWIPANQLSHHSPSIDHHTKDTPKNKVDMLLESVTGVADGLDEFVDFSMIAQAEALKFGVEHYRRRNPHCSGTLVWQLNDCWPGFSWSIVDYHGFKKAAYFFLRRAYAPVLASFRADPDGGVELWITNDTRSKLRDTVRVCLGRLAGGTVTAEELQVAVTAQTSARVAHWSAGELTGGPDSYLSVRSSTNAFLVNRHFFVAIKDLHRERPRAKTEVRAVGERELELRVRTDTYAYFLEASVPDERVRYSDNFIELEPGEERSIMIRHPDAALRPEDVTLRWR
jgi:beta-mannosidase